MFCFFFSGFAQFYSSRAGFCFDSFAVLSFRVFVLGMLLCWDMDKFIEICRLELRVLLFIHQFESK